MLHSSKLRVHPHSPTAALNVHNARCTVSNPGWHTLLGHVHLSWSYSAFAFPQACRHAHLQLAAHDMLDVEAQNVEAQVLVSIVGPQWCSSYVVDQLTVCCPALAICQR